MRVRLDEETLKDHRQSHARRIFLRGYGCRSAKNLQGSQHQAFFEQRETEVTALFAAAAAALALVSGMLSMLWFNRIL
jgi:Ca-activated chloride channel family protein